MPDVAFSRFVRTSDRRDSLDCRWKPWHTAIDHAKCVIGALDHSMPFTQGQSVVDASSLDYLSETM